APQPLSRRAQAAAHASALRLLAFGPGLRLGFRARIEFAADQLHLCNLGAVALAIAEAQQAGVAARPLREPRRDGIEQLPDHLAILQVLHHHAARGQRVTIAARREAALGDGDQALDERAELLRARHR